MLSTRIKLKCNEGRPLPKPYFQFPNDAIPGHFDHLPDAQVSFLRESSLAHTVFLEIMPLLAGILIFLFFLISSCFIVYGVIRHIYTDHMLPKRRRVLKKLGKLPDHRKRKRYRKRHSHPNKHHGQQSAHPSKEKDSTLNSSTTTMSQTSKKSKKRHSVQKPYYLDEYSNASDEEEDVQQILSDTAPPILVKKRAPQVVPKLIRIPGEPFPTLPDAPLSSKEKSNPKILPKTPTKKSLPPGSSEILEAPTPRKHWSGTYHHDREDKEELEAKNDVTKLTKKQDTLRERVKQRFAHLQEEENKPKKTRRNKATTSKSAE